MDAFLKDKECFLEHALPAGQKPREKLSHRGASEETRTWANLQFSRAQTPREKNMQCGAVSGEDVWEFEQVGSVHWSLRYFGQIGFGWMPGQDEGERQ